MQKFLNEVTNILKQNDVYHTIEPSRDASGEQTSLTDTYSVFYFQEIKPRKSKKTNNSQESGEKRKNAEKEVVKCDAIPVLQIKHNPQSYNLSIYVDQIQAYNFDKFKHNYRPVGIRNSIEQSETQQTLDKILDLCIAKSNKMHLIQITGIKKILKGNKIR